MNVINTPFSDTEIIGSELPFWQSQSFIDLLFDAGRYLLVMLDAWLLWRKLVWPQLATSDALTNRYHGFQDG